MQQMLPTLRKDRSPAFKFCPSVTKNVTTLIWEQLDNYFGMMQVRGVDGAAPSVLQVGISDYMARPAYYGENMPITEKEIMDRRQIGTVNAPVDIQDIVMIRSNQLLHRQFTLEEYLTWQLTINGYYMIVNPITGAVTAQDSYTQRVYTASTPWSTASTSTPLQDFRNVWLLHRGYSVTFGTAARAYMNRTTFNYLAANRNSNDLYGQVGGRLFDASVQSLLSLEGINTVLMGEGLAMIEVYDEGFYDSTNTFQTWIPNNKVLVVGERLDGSRIIEYCYTANLANMDTGAGPAYRVWMKNEDVPKPVVYRGFNGVHKMNFPSAFVVMNV
jgi:hypothetical protein